MHVVQRVVWLAVDANFEVQVRSGAEAGSSFISDKFAFVHALSLIDCRARHMGVQRSQSFAMADDNHFPVAAVPACEEHSSAVGSMYFRVVWSGKIDACVEFTHA